MLNVQSLFGCMKVSAVAMILMSTVVHTAVSEANDSMPYQSQTLLRKLDGTFQVVLPVPTEFKDVRQGADFSSIVNLYDKRTPLPAVTVMGSNFAFLKNGTMITVSANGYLYYKGKVPFTPETVGGVYFIKKGSGQLVTVDSSGFYNETGIVPGSLRLVGGNYYIDSNNELTTIKSQGLAPGNVIGQVTKKTGWSFANAALAGGNFFINGDSTIVTIDSVNGFFNQSSVIPTSKVAKVGGNYFITENNDLYTVSFEGQVKGPVALGAKPVRMGYSYVLFEDGSFKIVDALGDVHENAVSVSTTGIYRNVVFALPAGMVDLVPSFLTPAKGRVN